VTSVSQQIFTDPVPGLLNRRPTERGCVLSPDGLYRYLLWRTWNPKANTMVWLMLNPSTADAMNDDPTIRRCIGFAQREGCGSIQVLNLYALRATKPKHLFDHPDPEGGVSFRSERHPYLLASV
jgi:hypothetical protein